MVPRPKTIKPSIIVDVKVAFAITNPPQFAKAKTIIAIITPIPLLFLDLAYLDISGCKIAPVIHPPITIVIPTPKEAGFVGALEQQHYIQIDLWLLYLNTHT